MQSAESGPLLKPISLYTRKREESKTSAMLSLTNKNWARLLRLASEYQNRFGKQVTEDDILNMIVNSYYKTILRRVRNLDKTL